MHSSPKIPDFDTLRQLFQQDPEAFETFRKRMLDDAVARCPAWYRQNMQHVLMRIEIARQAASTPLESLAYATRLMCESLDELNDALHQLQQELTDLQSLLVLKRIMSSSQNMPQQRPESGWEYGA